MPASVVNLFGPDLLIIIAVLGVLLAVPVGLGILLFVVLRKKERRDPDAPPPASRDR